MTSNGAPLGIFPSLSPSASLPSLSPPSHRRDKHPEELHKAREGGEETDEGGDKEGSEAEGDREGKTPRGAPLEVIHVGGNVPSPEENADLPGFHPERAHLLLQGVYGDFLHHNNGSHLDRGIMDEDVWQRCWHQIAAQSASWYATPSGAVGRRFTAILAVEWRGVLGKSWNYERPLVFVHVVITKTLGVHRA